MRTLPSERAAFRWVVVIAIGAAAVVAVAAVFGGTAGAFVMVGLFGMGIGYVWGRATGEGTAEARAGSERTALRRILAVVVEAPVDESLAAELRNRARGRTTQIRVALCALTGRPERPWAEGADPELDEARRRLDTILTDLRGAGLVADGQLAAADPVAAIIGVAGDFPADEVVLATPLADPAAFEIAARVRDEVTLPVTHVA